MATLFARGVRKLKRIAIRRSASFRSPLKVAIIGYGGIAPDHHLAYEESGIARVVAISDINPSALAGALDSWPGLRADRDYRRMLDEVRPDVVSVCTWPATHAEIVEAAAAVGVKGILCEKPLALQLADLRRMRAACEAHGVKIAGGHQYRFHPNFIAAAGLVRSGSLGQVLRIRGHIKSTLANNGPHLIDTVRFLLGDPAAIRVECRCRRTRDEFDRGFPSEDSAAGEITFAGHIKFEFRTGDLAPNFFAITIEGSDGSVEVSPRDLRTAGATRAPRRPAGGEFRSRQFGEFLRWVKGQRSGYAADLEQGSATAEVVLAAYESARQGRPVEFPIQNEGDVIRSLYPDATATASGAVPAPPATMAHAAIAGRLAADGGPRAVTRWFSTSATVGRAELANLARVVASRHLGSTDGRMVPALEREMAEYYGSPHAVASTSGTAAIHVALGALGLDPGDEVITTPMTDMGTVIPILACNCLPVFADIDPVTGNLTAESIERRITPRTKAVILVHLFGRPADLGPIGDLLRDRGISLVEDCAQAHDAEYRGRKVGTFGDFGCFSFQQSKQITCGDGGITLVNRGDLADRAAMFVDKGWDRKHGLRSHIFLGMNYRMTELQAAVVRAQLRKLPALIRARREAADALTQELAALPGVVVPASRGGTLSSWWMYPLGIDEDRLGVGIDDVCDALRVEGVRIRREYLPRPIFEYDVIRYRNTYGNSHYPFSAFPYEAPDIEDFPGYREFVRGLMFMTWSSRVCPHHVAQIASAFRKVIRLLAHEGGVRHSRGLEPSTT